jgi:uncharacterized iron-regulated membrane protein
MNGTFRQSMAWLHTWCGLIGGWVLLVIFITGTLAVFAEPITHWMQDEPPARASAPVSPAHAVTVAQRHLEHAAPDAQRWEIGLPGGADSRLRLAWTLSDGARHEASLDTGSGGCCARPAAARPMAASISWSRTTSCTPA